MKNVNLDRITSEMYVHIAEQICEQVKSYSSTISVSVENAEVEFSGFAFLSDNATPLHIFPTWVECHTYNDDGDLTANNFRSDTLMAYIQERLDDNLLKKS